MSAACSVGRCAVFALLVVSVVLVLGGGCGLDEWARNGAKVGPNYTTAPSAVSDNWIDYRDPRMKSQEMDLGRWWSVFNDPALNSLIDQAVRENLTVNAAGERIVEARAQRGIAVGQLFPQEQNLSGSYSANKLSNQTKNHFSSEWFQNWNAGFNASWELDFWGRYRRAVEAADANLEASIADFDDVMVVLLSDVAANYVQYRTFQERIVVAQRNVEIQSKSYQLALDKFNAGAATERDAQQSKQILEQTRASIPQLEAGMRQANNALCALLGLSPRDLSERLGTAGKIPTAPPELALGIPADLLRRRPDVRRYERLAAAQSAFIGVAKSDLYPHFFIDGSIGVAAENFGDLFKTPGSMTGFVGPSFRWDILNYGRIENNVEVQKARFRQAVLAYQNAVLRAGQESEDAAVSFLKAQERARFLDQSVAAADRTVQIVHDQYKEGIIDFTPVFLFEGTLADQQDALVVAQGQIALSLVDLYRSLGGGWQVRLESGPVPASQPTEKRPAPVAMSRN